jgi:tetratricopeptide (TPR) repeat protein
MFSPKVIQLADEARAEQNEARCRNLLTEAQRQIATGNPDAVVKVIDGDQAKCSGLAALNPQVADLFYKEGLEAYKKTQMEAAVQKFRAALHAEPKHELAAQYLDLTESKLEIAADRALLAWRKDFASGDYALAARDYRELASRSNAETINDIRMQYRQALSNLVDSWNRACASNDADSMEDVRVRVNSMLPEPSFAEDILEKMKTCTPTGCLQMNSQLALARLRNRVDPQFTSFMIAQLKASSVTIRVKARINESGAVTVSEPQGGNPLLYPAIRDAVQQWKFSPTVMQGQARCVDTEIPIVINFAPK